MRALGDANCQDHGKRPLKSWLARAAARALQLMIESISARAEAVGGTRRPGHS